MRRKALVEKPRSRSSQCPVAVRGLIGRDRVADCVRVGARPVACLHNSAILQRGLSTAGRSPTRRRACSRRGTFSWGRASSVLANSTEKIDRGHPIGEVDLTLGCPYRHIHGLHSKLVALIRSHRRCRYLEGAIAPLRELERGGPIGDRRRILPRACRSQFQLDGPAGNFQRLLPALSPTGMGKGQKEGPYKDGENGCTHKPGEGERCNLEEGGSTTYPGEGRSVSARGVIRRRGEPDRGRGFERKGQLPFLFLKDGVRNASRIRVRLDLRRD